MNRDILINMVSAYASMIPTKYDEIKSKEEGIKEAGKAKAKQSFAKARLKRKKR